MSTETENNSKSVILPTFSGADKDYSIFWARFQAYAEIKGFGDALARTTSALPNDPKILSTVDEDKKKEEKAMKMNKLAVASFTMAFTTGALMDYVDHSKTDKYPGGIAYKIVNRLKKKYRPGDRIASVEAEKELMKLKMKSSEDPDDYFDRLAVLKNRYKHCPATFDEDKMIAATIAKAPIAYGSTIGAEMRAKGEDLTLDDLQAAMKEYWRIKYNLVTGNNTRNEDDDSGDD